jgi:MFS family permease
MSDTLDGRPARDRRFFIFLVPAFFIWMIGEYFFPVFATDQMNVLIPHFVGTYGWDQALITGPNGVGRIIGFPAPLLWGWLIIKLGPKWVFSFSLLLYGVSELLVATYAMHESYAIFYVGIAAIPPIGTALLMSTFSLVKNWFRDWRGTALGIVTFVSPVGNATSTQYMTAGANGSLGFTATMSIISILVIVVALIGMAIVRSKPEDVGCFPDGKFMAPPPENLVMEDGVDKIKVWHVLRHKEAWIHMFIFGVCGMAMVVYPGFFIPRFTELGFTPGQATAFTYGFSLLGGALSLASGVIDDKLGTRNATIIIFALFFLGTIGLRFGNPDSPWLIWVGIISLGGIVGAYPNLNPSMVAYTYGRKSFDRVFMYINTGVYILPALGMPYVTTLYAADGGSYNLSYTIMIPIALISLILVIFNRKKLDLTRHVAEDAARKGEA